MSPIDVRTATLAQLDTIRQLSIATFTETFAATNTEADMQQYLETAMNETQLHSELIDPANTFYLLYVNEEPAGYAKVRISPTPEGITPTRPLELERIYVLQTYQGIKAGAALLQHCLQYAKNHGHDVLWLGVWEHNHKAIRFYERWGFQHFGAHEFVLGTDRQTDLLFWREV